MARLEEVLRRGDANNQEQLYETLRVYLMLGQPNHLEPESVQAWLDLDWRRSLPQASSAQRDELAAHVGALLDSGGVAADPPPLDAGLVSAVRSTLAMMPLPERVYNRLKRKVGQARLPEFSVNRAAGRDVSALLARKSGEPLTRGVPGLYSVAGYRELLKQAPAALADIAKDSWVLDRREAEGAVAGLTSDQMNAAVLRLYYADYIRAWDALLADVRIAPFQSRPGRPHHQCAGRRRLAAEGLPDRPRRARPRSRASAPARPRWRSIRRCATSCRTRARSSRRRSAPTSTPRRWRRSNPVDQHFAALHKLVGSKEAPGQLDAQLAMLKDASQFFDAADQARRAGTPAPGGEALQKIKRAAEGTPAPLGDMLQTVDSAGSNLTLGSERARVKALWAAEGARFCARRDRRPLSAGARRFARRDRRRLRQVLRPGRPDGRFLHQEPGGLRWTCPAASGAGATPARPGRHVAGGAEPVPARGPRARHVFRRRPPALAALRTDAAGRRRRPDEGGARHRRPAGGLRKRQPTRPVRRSRCPPAKAGARCASRRRRRCAPTCAVKGPWAWFRMIDKGMLQPAGQANALR
jgi:type VI secretion system protein ImpL